MHHQYNSSTEDIVTALLNLCTGRRCVANSRPCRFTPVKDPHFHSVGTLLGSIANLIAVDTWPGTEPRFFCCPARGVATETTKLFRLLYFVATSEQSLEIREINEHYPLRIRTKLCNPSGLLPTKISLSIFWVVEIFIRVGHELVQLQRGMLDFCHTSPFIERIAAP
jgi:hypothetical protein